MFGLLAKHSHIDVNILWHARDIKFGQRPKGLTKPKMHADASKKLAEQFGAALGTMRLGANHARTIT